MMILLFTHMPPFCQACWPIVSLPKPPAPHHTHTLSLSYSLFYTLTLLHSDTQLQRILWIPLFTAAFPSSQQQRTSANSPMLLCCSEINTYSIRVICPTRACELEQDRSVIKINPCFFTRVNIVVE